MDKIDDMALPIVLLFGILNFVIQVYFYNYSLFVILQLILEIIITNFIVED